MHMNAFIGKFYHFFFFFFFLLLDVVYMFNCIFSVQSHLKICDFSKMHMNAFKETFYNYFYIAF